MTTMIEPVAPIAEETAECADVEDSYPEAGYSTDAAGTFEG